jgi:hypothetical protein
MSTLHGDGEAGVRKAIDIAIRVLESWRDEASDIAAVNCHMESPCDEVIERPDGWRESATQKLIVEITRKGQKVRAERAT